MTKRQAAIAFARHFEVGPDADDLSERILNDPNEVNEFVKTAKADFPADFALQAEILAEDFFDAEEAE